MNILFAVPWDQRTGGVTHVVTTLARGLEARGHRCVFLFPSDGGFRIRNGTSVHGFPSVYCRLRRYPPEHASWRDRVSWCSTIAAALPQLSRYGRSRHIDLINVHYPGDGFTLLVDLAHRLKVPFVVSAHGSDLLADDGPRRGRGLLRQFQNADAVVVPSQNYLASVVEAYPELQNKIRYIYNGYDEGEIAALRALPVSRSALDVTALCIAALIPKKGVDVLLRALHECKSGRLKLRLVGEGPLSRDLEALTSALGLSDRVSFLGPMERGGIFDEIAQCDFLVVPSRHASESFGLAALEAMALAKPVVASAIGGLRELVGDGESGLLVRPEDPGALADALDRLADDAELRVRLGVGGRAKAKKFTAGATADGYQALFEELVTGADGAAQPRAVGSHDEGTPRFSE